jgi:hypothetical protein
MNELPIENGAIPISSGKMVRFAANFPIEIALACVDGIRIEGRYGDRIKYTLTDDRTMYVNPGVAERIKELDVQPGEVFQICKRQAKKGNRKTIDWIVERPDDFQLERDLRESLERARAVESPSHVFVPSSPTSPLAPSGPEPPPSPFYELGCSSANGSSPGHRIPSGSENPSAPARPSADDVPPRPPDTQLAYALKTAIAAAADAEKFAKTLDYTIRFSTEDVRSMGITVLIGMQQRTPR